jgi:hypothetical protein
LAIVALCTAPKGDRLLNRRGGALLTASERSLTTDDHRQPIQKENMTQDHQHHAERWQDRSFASDKTFAAASRAFFRQ